MERRQEPVHTRQLSRAFASTRAVLAAVGPEQWGAATPCGAWDVRALVDHFLGSARWGAAAVTDPGAGTGSGAGAGTDPGAGPGAETAGEGGAVGDVLARYDEIISVALAAFGAPDVPERKVALPIGDFSGVELLHILTRDQFTHGWDLARAIGYDTDLDPELAEELLAEARDAVLDAYRDPEGAALFGPAVEAPAGARPADRLAAFLGRSI